MLTPLALPQGPSAVQGRKKRYQGIAVPVSRPRPEVRGAGLGVLGAHFLSSGVSEAFCCQDQTQASPGPCRGLAPRGCGEL